MFERFTDRARTTVVLAQQHARERGDETIGTEHLLRALVAAPDGRAALVLEAFSVRPADVLADLDRPRPPADAEALAALGIDLDEVRRRAEEAFGEGALDRAPRPRRRRWGHIPFAKDAKKALELSLREALRMRHGALGTEHLLLGLLHDGAACDVLAGRGVRLDAARVVVAEVVRGRRAG